MGATTSTLRWRRSAAQMHALQQIEREIRATDPHLRRKYLRDFTNAFREYESVLSEPQAAAIVQSADVILVGDYHALPASQRYAGALVRQLAESGRQVVLGLETIFSRDQHILDEWRQGEISGGELRQRIRFDFEWGYDWQPFYELLEVARAHAHRIYGLDCVPRNDLRRISARDRHAAIKIGEVRERHPDCSIVTLFGESHLAPKHLPALLRERCPLDRILTVLQNVDSLYWRAAGESRFAQAVRINEQTICVFTSTPLEKYQSYRFYIDRWQQERPRALDFAPTFDNLIDALLRFLNIDKYSPTSGTQPKYLVDQLPEIRSRASDEQVIRMLLRWGLTQEQAEAIAAELTSAGSCYVPRLRTVFARRFEMMRASEDVARGVHHACRAFSNTAPATVEDRFYTGVMENALAVFGSRVLYPARPALRESDLYALYTRPVHELELPQLRYDEYLQTLDFLVLHKDYEANARFYRSTPELINEAVGWTGARFEYVSRQLGAMLGTELYDAFVSGRVPKRFVRSLFFRDLTPHGSARLAYFIAARRVKKPRRLLVRN
jgi:hypothetical protein